MSDYIEFSVVDDEDIAADVFLIRKTDIIDIMATPADYTDSNGLWYVEIRCLNKEYRVVRGYKDAALDKLREFKKELDG
jgi:hypothetical protein